MFTQVRTPQDVFFSPQKLVVPLFQRPYVWSRDAQWLPLWNDVIRVSERIYSAGYAAPHFLGAVVLQQQPNEIGSLSMRTVIDGQQRLTTLQLLLDAVRRELIDLNLEGLAAQAQNLVANQREYRKAPEDSFKVWPTNRDRSAFEFCMDPDAESKQGGNHPRSRIIEAHRFFRESARAWLAEGDTARRGQALFDSVSRFLQIVVIDLQPDEDAQEIFETLNARGTPLTAADLIKNFVFQRLDGDGDGAEDSYLRYWQQFETPFWEEAVSAGRLQYTRSSLFLTQWLVSQTKEDITAREVFSRFKFFVNDSPDPVNELLPKLRRAADVYQRLVEGSRSEEKKVSRAELFLYRMSTLDSEVVKPLILWLFDPEQSPVPQVQVTKALDSIESWAVRRALLRLSTKNYNKMVIELLKRLSTAPRAEAGDVTENYLAGQTSANGYWPTDSEIKSAITREPIYRRITRARLRMLLEALEDERRGIGSEAEKFSEGRVSRGKASIEHLLPQEWRTNWGDFTFNEDEVDEQALVHQLGNLTLVTQQLNSKVSNAAWGRKRAAFEEHTTLLITADVVKQATQQWTADMIQTRSAELADKVVRIWPVPDSNLGLIELSTYRSGTRVHVADLVREGYIRPGQPIYARTKAHFGRVAFVSEDGRIFVDDKPFETLSAAARFVTGSSAEDGWWFWVTNTETLESLIDLRAQFRADNEIDEEDPEFEPDE